MGASNAKSVSEYKTSSTRVAPSGGDDARATKLRDRAVSMPRPRFINKKKNYKIGKTLGRGHFAEVHECVDVITNETYAVKIFEKDPNNDPTVIREEVEILRKVGHHPNIVGLVDFYEDEHDFYLVMEYCRGGDLFSKIISEGKYTEKMAASLCYQLASAIQHMHKHGVVHRDLKPENILLVSKDPDSPIKIVDFGLSKIINNSATIMKTVCGTWAYCAPEVLEGSPYTEEVDVWALGVLMFILLCGYHPFDMYGNLPEPELLEHISNVDYSFNDPVWDDISDEPKRIIASIFHKDPRQRMTLAQYLKSPWVLQGNSGPSKILQEAIMRLQELYKHRKSARMAVIAKISSDRRKRVEQRKGCRSAPPSEDLGIHIQENNNEEEDTKELPQIEEVKTPVTSPQSPILQKSAAYTNSPQAYEHGVESPESAAQAPYQQATQDSDYSTYSRH